MNLHQTNRRLASKLMSIKDERGRVALSEPQCKVLEIIGRFDREDGNFMSPKSMQGLFSGRPMSTRTLRRHLRYLADQKIIFSSYRDDGRLVWRLSEEIPERIESLAAYRERLGMSEYAYRRQKMTNTSNKNSLFLGDENDKFCPLPKANFAPPNKDEFRINDSKRLNHPPLSPLSAPNETSNGGPSAPDAGAARPHGRGSRRGNGGGIHSPTEGKISEPIPKGGRKKRTMAERAAEAARLLENGHVVNPLGRPDLGGRKLKPSLAAEISPSSDAAVTIPQLFRAYVEIYDGAFGIPGLLEEQIPATREFMEHFVGQLRQVFYDVCGYSPTNRDVWEYIKWFHEPEMLASLRRVSNRVPDHPGVPHPNQLRGKVYVKSFYDRHLACKNPRPVELMGKYELQARENHRLVREAYEALRNAGDQDLDLVLCLTTYGYVIFSEYLRDTRDLNPSDAKRYMINLMARHLRKAVDKAAAEKFLGDTFRTTEGLPIQDSTLWPDWRAELRDAVKVAAELSRQANPQGIQA